MITLLWLKRRSRSSINDIPRSGIKALLPLALLPPLMSRPQFLAHSNSAIQREDGCGTYLRGFQADREGRVAFIRI